MRYSPIVAAMIGFAAHFTACTPNSVSVNNPSPVGPVTPPTPPPPPTPPSSSPGVRVVDAAFNNPTSVNPGLNAAVSAQSLQGIWTTPLSQGAEATSLEVYIFAGNQYQHIMPVQMNQNSNGNSTITSAMVEAGTFVIEGTTFKKTPTQSSCAGIQGGRVFSATAEKIQQLSAGNTNTARRIQLGFFEFSYNGSGQISGYSLVCRVVDGLNERIIPVGSLTPMSANTH